MNGTPRLSIVVPCKDEAESVPALAAALRGVRERATREVEFLLVDDGSVDATLSALATAFSGQPARVLRHERNRGLGAALRTGSLAAEGPLVAWLDADSTYDPAILLPLADAVDAGADLALASCHHPDGAVEGVSAGRRWLSRMASRLYRWRSGARLWTFTGMVRVWRRELLLRCLSPRDDFLAVSDSLLRALTAGAKVVEVPATLRARTTGRSKMRLLRATLAHLRQLAWSQRGQTPIGSPGVSEPK